MRIRKVTRKDKPEWLRMRFELWPHCSLTEHRREINDYFKTRRKDVVFVAALNTDELCGFAELSLRSDYVPGAQASPVAYLEGWYVDPEYRQEGVGKRLLKFAEQWAQRHGILELASDAELSNRASIDAHLACGFNDIETTVHFIKRLEPPSR